MEQLIGSLSEDPNALEKMQALETLAEIVLPLPLGLNLWKVQNTYWEMIQKVFPQFRDRASSGDETAKTWLNNFIQLGDRLGFAVKHLKESAPALQAAA
jgi:hypothetical protein